METYHPPKKNDKNLLSLVIQASESPLGGQNQYSQLAAVCGAILPLQGLSVGQLLDGKLCL